MEKVQNRLTRWKAKNLSLVRRCTLTHSVLVVIPSYSMQTIWLPQVTCDTLNKLNINFLCGSNSEKRIIHLVKWDKVTKQKMVGGLGICESRMANVAQLAKIGSRVACGSNKMWAQVIYSKYLKNERIFNYDTKLSNSSIWKGIIRSLKMVEGGFCWKIRNVRDVSIWFDIWIGNKSICLFIDDIDPLKIMWNVADILNSDGFWNLASLKTIIPNNIREKIQAIQLNPNDTKKDSVVWKRSANGVSTANFFFQFH